MQMIISSIFMAAGRQMERWLGIGAIARLSRVVRQWRRARSTDLADTRSEPATLDWRIFEHINPPSARNRLVIYIDVESIAGVMKNSN
jgi:hypothetical protein